MTDQDFISAFEACTLPPADFHHRDHVRLAWLYLQREPLLAALGRFCAGIQRFAAAAGRPERYHVTITWAYMLLIHERMERGGPGLSWAEFAAGNPDLFDWAERPVLERYYHQDTLRSDLARRTFLLPDRCLGPATL